MFLCFTTQKVLRQRRRRSRMHRMSDSVMNEKTSSHDIQPSSDTSLIVYAVAALALALFVRFYVATPYIVSGASMEHTYENYDYLIVDRLTYDVRTPERGEVIVFGLPQEPSRDLIKRVIALPGETVRISGPEPRVTIINTEHPGGFILSEPYLTRENLGGATDITMTLTADQYFVLGDNRKVSADSRMWGILPRKDIVGRVFLRLYPFSMIGFFPGVAHY